MNIDELIDVRYQNEETSRRQVAEFVKGFWSFQLTAEQKKLLAEPLRSRSGIIDLAADSNPNVRRHVRTVIYEARLCAIASFKEPSTSSTSDSHLTAGASHEPGASTSFTMDMEA